MSFKPRDYQEKAVVSILGEFIEHDSTLVCCPTGTGKTVIFAELIRRLIPQRTMVLAHREELITQAKRKIDEIASVECEIEMANFSARDNALWSTPVIVSTVQTQGSGATGAERMRRFNPMEFGLLIIDEAHHSASKSYRKIIDYYRQNPNLKVLGVTATPDRADELALGEIFQTVAFDYEIIDAIHGGYLVPVDQQFVTVSGLDFSAVRTTAGDLNGADLARVMEQEENMHRVASASIDIIGDKRTLVFSASVLQSETLANIFNRHRYGMARSVSGKTDKDERKQLLADFYNGKTQVVCNCGVLTEGYDNPGVEVVVMARPTKSRSLYSQMVGRGTRSLTGVIDHIDDPEARRAAIAASAKPSVLIVDFVGNSGRHKLITSADILGGKSSEEAIELAVEKAKQGGGRKSISGLLTEAESELQKVKLLAAENARMADEARKARLIAKAAFSTSAVDPFGVYEVKYQPANDWDRRNGRAFSEKQAAILLKIGVRPDSVSYTCGKQLIGAYFTKPTPKQIYWLQKLGHDTTGMTREDGKKILDAHWGNRKDSI